MQRKLSFKPCKGVLKAKGRGCGDDSNNRHLGLCPKCYFTYLKETNQMNSFLASAKRKAENERKKETREKKKTIAPKKSNKIKIYTSMAWKYCSRYVLLFYSDNDGVVECSTSGRKYQLPNKNIQCGHYYKATEHARLAFEFTNLAPQSYSDNVYYSGKPEIMKEWIKNTHGIDALELLDRLKHEDMKLDDFTLDELKGKYKSLFDDLVKIKGFNPWKR